MLDAQFVSHYLAHNYEGNGSAQQCYHDNDYQIMHLHIFFVDKENLTLIFLLSHFNLRGFSLCSLALSHHLY
jgi:hypothetical protein